MPPTGAPAPTGSPAPTGTTATSAASTTSTTRPPTVAEQLQTLLEATLLGEADPPPPGTPPRVRVTYDVDELVRVSWDLDDTLSTTAQRYAAREEATALLRVIQGFAEIGEEPVVLRALLPDPDTGDPSRVVRLLFERDTLDALDFSTLDPLTIFERADEADIDPALAPTPPPTTSTSSTTTTTTKH